MRNSRHGDTGTESYYVVADLYLLKLWCEQAYVRPDRDIAFVDGPHQQRSAPQQPRLFALGKKPRCRLRITELLIGEVHFGSVFGLDSAGAAAGWHQDR